MQNLIHKFSKYLYSQYWKGKPPKSPPTDECPRKLLSVPWALKPPLVFSTYHICPLLGLERPWPRPEPWGTDLLIGPCLLLSLAVSGILSRQQVWLGLEPKGQIPDLGSTHFWELPGLQPELLYSLTGHPYLLGLRCSACHRPREQTHDCWLCSLWGPRTWGWRQLFFFFLTAHGVPGPGIRSQPQLWPHWICNALCRAGDQIWAPELPRCCRSHYATVGTPWLPP